ncbi:uncharacterized protein [Argopecten irradians]|uniref:uncharacterized protein n=1 Tax=Argopecten irradians TaxID=31199 RepID=UPI003721FB21
MSSDLCGGMEYVFPDLSQDDMVKLRGAHIEDSATHYNSIKTEINQRHLLSRYVLISTFLTRKTTCVYTGVSMACLTFIFSVMFFMYWGNESLHAKGTQYLFWIIGSFLAIPAGLGVSSGLVIIWKKQVKSKILTGLKAVALNKMKLKKSKFIVLPKFWTTDFPLTEALHIVFVYYDISPCWTHLKEHVEWFDNSTEYINERCDQLFKEMIMQRYFNSEDFPITKTPRHPTVSSQQCFCEVLEDKYGSKYEQLEKQTEQTEGEDTCQVEVLGSEETCLMEVVGSEETCRIEVAETEDTCRMEIAGSDETCRMKVAGSEETCRAEVAGSDETCVKEVVRTGLSENT